MDIIIDELVDQYVEDDLSAEERERLEQHFFKSSKRREKLDFALALNKEISALATKKNQTIAFPLKMRRSLADLFSSTYLKAAAIIILAVGIGFGGWLLLARPSDVDRGMVALKAAYKNQRLIEARITNLDYAPLIITRGQEKPDIDYIARDRAERLLLDALGDHPDAKAHHALGRFYLAGKQFDKAVEQFETGLSQEPNNAQLHNDLGAALLELGQQAKLNNESGKALTLLAQSIEHINKALQLEPSLLEALYNKALCLQYMMLPEQAKEAWQAYLAHDSQSKWAEEARRNLQLLSEQGASPPTAPQLLESFLAAFRARDDGHAWEIMSRNREIITGKMIPPQLARNYVSLKLSGQEESAQESLRALLFAGELDRQRGGDRYTSELAHYYATSSVAQRHILAEAIENLYQGYKLCLDTKYSAAEQCFESARDLFSKAGNTWEEKLAEYWISYCFTQADRIKESIALLKPIAEFCRSRSYKWLLAEAYGWLAIDHSILSETSNAIRYHQQSLALAEAISDTYQMQKVLTELGNVYADLRQPQLSLDYYYQSLSLAFRFNTSSRQSWRNFSYTTAALFTFKYYEAAAAFTNEALYLGTKELDDPSLNYLMHLNLGRIYSKLQRFDEALYQANLGLRIAQSAQDAVASRKLTATALLHQADIWREARNFEQAINYYNQAIALYDQMEFDLQRYPAYKGRLLCSLALKDEKSIQHELPLLLQLFERYRSQIREEQNRNSFFDTEQSVYDIAIEYEYGKQNYSAAFNYAEEARSRSLLDALHSGPHVETTSTGPDMVFSQVSHPLDLDSIRQHIPAQVQIVAYTILPTKLLIWTISRERFAVFEREITAEALETKVKLYVDSLQDHNAESRQGSSEQGTKLYDILLRSVEETFAPGQKICIIPDKFLYLLPFNALVSPETGRYFIEERAVFYAPSLNVLWHCSETAQRRTQVEQESVLSVGNPTFDRQAYPDLAPLQAAEREAREIATLYDKSTCLLGPEADKASTFDALSSAEVVHFAGHYVIDEATPLLSKMLLADRAPHDAESSALSASEILEHRLDHTKLIVLSACQTGLDKYFNGEGAVGLSRTFIAAGVPLIVASQWPVDSDATANLMISFHRNRRAGLSTVEALRQAQVEMLHGPDQTYQLPYYWAAFLCVGGYADY